MILNSIVVLTWGSPFHASIFLMTNWSASHSAIVPRTSLLSWREIVLQLLKTHACLPHHSWSVLRYGDVSFVGLGWSGLSWKRAKSPGWNLFCFSTVTGVWANLVAIKSAWNLVEISRMVLRSSSSNLNHFDYFPSLVECLATWGKVHLAIKILGQMPCILFQNWSTHLKWRW